MYRKKGDIPVQEYKLVWQFSLPAKAVCHNLVCAETVCNLLLNAGTAVPDKWLPSKFKSV